MTTVKAVVRNGRIEVAAPLDLPDGTELTIPIPGPTTLGLKEEDWSDAPEDVEAWINWYNSLEPLEFTAAERAAWEAARRDDNQPRLADALACLWI